LHKHLKVETIGITPEDLTQRISGQSTNEFAKGFGNGNSHKNSSSEKGTSLSAANNRGAVTEVHEVSD
jgi:hypothetical protein